MRHAFWIETQLQLVWAVELDDGVVTACYGPLTMDEIDDDLLETFDYGPGGAAWIREHSERFSPHVLAVPDFPAT